MRLSGALWRPAPLPLRRPPQPPRAAADPPPSPPPLDALVEVGTFGAPHGVRGEVRLFPSTDDPATRLAPKSDERWVTPRPGTGRLLGRPPPPPRPVTIAASRPAPSSRDAGAWLVRLDGVSDVDEAALLTNCVLWVEAAARPPLPPDSDEWYVQELVGAIAVDGEGGIVGEVTHVIVGGGGGADLLRLALPLAPGDNPADIIEPSTVLLPFTKEFVPSVDAAGGRVVIAPPLGWLEAATKVRRRQDKAGRKKRPSTTRKARDSGARVAAEAAGEGGSAATEGE